MKKYVAALAVVVAFGVVLVGCGKKQASTESQEAISMESLSTINTSAPATTGPVTTETQPTAAVTQPSTPAVQAPVQPVQMPSTIAKPTAIEIQTALKNAGYYTGNVDGKIGPKSKLAIEEFQKANGLTADGKVGPKTWAALGKYLVAAAITESPKQ